MKGSFTATALEQQAYRDWATGKVIPDRITTALDAQACGVEEPAVDLWEAGTLYPTWEQLCALARLVDLPVGVFTMEPSAVARGAVWICDRRHGGGCTLVERDPGAGVHGRGDRCREPAPSPDPAEQHADAAYGG